MQFNWSFYITRLKTRRYLWQMPIWFFPPSKSYSLWYLSSIPTAPSKKAASKPCLEMAYALAWRIFTCEWAADCRQPTACVCAYVPHKSQRRSVSHTRRKCVLPASSRRLWLALMEGWLVYVQFSSTLLGPLKVDRGHSPLILWTYFRPA